MLKLYVKTSGVINAHETLKSSKEKVTVLHYKLQNQAPKSARIAVLKISRKLQEKNL